MKRRYCDTPKRNVACPVDTGIADGFTDNSTQSDLNLRIASPPQPLTRRFIHGCSSAEYVVRDLAQIGSEFVEK